MISFLLDATVIFCYHKITSHLDFGICTRTPEDFQYDASWIASLPCEQRPHIIFDDGYEDTFEVAYPILDALGLRASLFVITNWIGKPNHWDANFFGTFQHISLCHLRQLAAAGWEIGSHGATHRALTTLSRHALRQELLGSKHYLEDALGVPVKRISFPFGMFNQVVLEACREAGYEAAISIRRRSACGFVERSLAVYRFDSMRRLHAKWRGSSLELARLRFINAFSGLTVLMHFVRNSVPEMKDVR